MWTEEALYYIGVITFFIWDWMFWMKNVWNNNDIQGQWYKITGFPSVICSAFVLKFLVIMGMCHFGYISVDVSERTFSTDEWSIEEWCKTRFDAQARLQNGHNPHAAPLLNELLPLTQESHIDTVD